VSGSQPKAPGFAGGYLLAQATPVEIRTSRMNFEE
jgi:hypothetical protein